MQDTKKYVDTLFGSDGNDGSFKKPFASVKHACSMVSEGDTINIFTFNVKPEELINGRSSFEIEMQLL